MQRRLNESTENYEKVNKNCYEFTDYVKISKTSVSTESVRKSAQRECHNDDQKRAT